MPRHRLNRIPREYFSAEYWGLPQRKRRLLNMRMRRKTALLWSNVEKTSEEAQKFNERLSNIFDSLKASKPTKISLFQEKATRHQLSEEMRKWGESYLKLHKFAEQWFKSFHPEMSGIEVSGLNPVEYSVHAIRSEMNTLYSYLKTASANLELIEKELIKRRRA